MGIRNKNLTENKKQLPCKISHKLYDNITNFLLIKLPMLFIKVLISVFYCFLFNIKETLINKNEIKQNTLRKNKIKLSVSFQILLF